MSIFLNGQKANDIYLNGQKIQSAFYNGEKIFGKESNIIDILGLGDENMSFDVKITAANQTFRFKGHNWQSGSYIEWGDGTTTNNLTNTTAETGPIKTYAQAGVYRFKMYGHCTGLDYGYGGIINAPPGSFQSDADANKITGKMIVKLDKTVNPPYVFGPRTKLNELITNLASDRTWQDITCPKVTLYDLTTIKTIAFHRAVIPDLYVLSVITTIGTYNFEHSTYTNLYINKNNTGINVANKTWFGFTWKSITLI